MMRNWMLFSALVLAGLVAVQAAGAVTAHMRIEREIARLVLENQNLRARF